MAPSPQDNVASLDADARSPVGKLCNACGCPIEPADKFCPACGTPCGAANASQPAIVLPSSAADRHASHDAADVVTAEAIETPQQKFFRCQNCASEVATSPDARSYVCPFCDSTYVIEFSPEQSGRQRPEFVIGFVITPEDALEKFRQWMSTNSWFRPGDLTQAMVADKMKGIYLPFWSFSMLAESDWSAQIGEYWYRTETYTDRDEKGNPVTRTRQVRETEWWPLSGRHHRYYNGYLVSGSRGLPQAEADQIQPFQLPALKRFEPYFLAGWLCEEYSIAREEALQRCQQEFYRREQGNVASFLPGDTHSQVSVNTTFRHVNSDLCLLPVYVLSYRYQDKLFRFVVNGQTGKLMGEKPVSWKRIGCAVAIAVGLGIAILVVAGIMQR